MKIRPVTAENLPKALALLRKVFPGNRPEPGWVSALHANDREVHDWVAIIRNRVEAYIAFTLAYRDGEPCGLHLGPLAVSAEMAGQGVASELVRFALSRKLVEGRMVYVLGPAAYYGRFAFKTATETTSPLASKKRPLLILGDEGKGPFEVGYEQEFMG